jgi:hypothetical protein
MSGKKVLTAVFGRSYPTTIAGYSAAVCLGAYDYLNHHDPNDPQFWAGLAGAVAVAVLGRLAKAEGYSNSPSPLPEAQPVKSDKQP